MRSGRRPRSARSWTPSATGRCWLGLGWSSAVGVRRPLSLVAAAVPRLPNRAGAEACGPPAPIRGCAGPRRMDAAVRATAGDRGLQRRVPTRPRHGGAAGRCRQVTDSSTRLCWVDEAWLRRMGVEPWTELPLWVPLARGKRVSTTSTFQGAWHRRPVPSPAGHGGGHLGLVARAAGRDARCRRAAQAMADTSKGGEPHSRGGPCSGSAGAARLSMSATRAVRRSSPLQAKSRHKSRRSLEPSVNVPAEVAAVITAGTDPNRCRHRR